ncbi:hypothetical protein [Burkholderia perseverans]|uniref:hypothetical protein n=1 Tax=Burkholderia perseverans TaxID=2615214 RepID=UPI001FF06615|nr:hypothetical protein [Burkholderia perseverans]
MSSILIENRTDKAVLIAIYSPFGPLAEGPVEADETKRFAIDTVPVDSQLTVRASYPVSESHTWIASIRHILRHSDDDVIVLTGSADGGDWRTA